MQVIERVLIGQLYCVPNPKSPLSGWVSELIANSDWIVIGDGSALRLPIPGSSARTFPAQSLTSSGVRNIKALQLAGFNELICDFCRVDH